MDEKEVNDVQEVEQDASPEQDVEVDSSTTEEAVEEQVEESDTTESKSEPEQIVPYERFKEVNDERKELQGLVTQLMQQKQQPQQPQESDPYANIDDPSTREWYRQRDKQVEKLVEKKLKDVVDGNYRPVIESLTSQLASMQEKEFRKEFPDIAPNSQEEKVIAGYINSGLTPKAAYWAVMGEKRANAAKTSQQQKKQQKVQQKAKANLETSSVPQGSPVAPMEAPSFEETFDKLYKEGGYGT